jgi:succinate dehydrogenase/fumarate reductase flavoprotein subunit
MSQTPRNLIVVGQGAAGLSAALSAAETAHARGIPIKITLVDKAAESEAGGNTRWSPSYMRMASPTQMEATFVGDMKEATKGQCDEAYFTRLAAEAPATVKWIAQHNIEFIQPTYYLAKGNIAGGCGRAGLRRFPGQPRDDALALRPPILEHRINFTRVSFQLRRRHSHGNATWRGSVG